MHCCKPDESPGLPTGIPIDMLTRVLEKIKDGLFRFLLHHILMSLLAKAGVFSAVPLMC